MTCDYLGQGCRAVCNLSGSDRLDHARVSILSVLPMVLRQEFAEIEISQEGAPCKATR